MAENRNILSNPLTRADDDQGRKMAATFGFGALVGVLIAAIVGLLRLFGENEAAGKPDGEFADAGFEAGRVRLPGSPAVGEQKSGKGKTTESPTISGPHTPEQGLTSTRWSLPTKYVVGVGLFLALVVIFNISRPVLSLIIFAALIAFIVRPMIRFFQGRMKLKRGLATVITYLLVLAVLILIPVLVVPQIIAAVNAVLALDFQAIGQSLAAYLESAAQSVATTPIIGQGMADSLAATAQAIEDLFAMGTPEPVSVDTSVTAIGGRLASTLGALVNILGPLVSAVISFVFMLLISLHMSLSSEAMLEAYPRLIPEVYEGEISELVQRIFNIWSAFLRGQLALMFFVGLLVYIVNLILGTPQALFLGLTAGILEIIPSLGPFLATIPAVILALVFGSNHFNVSPLVFALMVIVGYMIVQALENQVMVPYILGDAVNLPPLVVIVGVTIGGAAFGLLGIFLSTPVISSGKEIFGYLYNKILEPSEVKAPPEEKPSLLDSVRGWASRIRLPIRRDDSAADEGHPVRSRLQSRHKERLDETKTGSEIPNQGEDNIHPGAEVSLQEPVTDK